MREPTNGGAGGKAKKSARAAFIALACGLALAPAQAAPEQAATAPATPARSTPAATPESVSGSFARAVIDADVAALQAIATEPMAAAMTEDALAQMLGAVTAQIGAIAGVGEPRHDDNVGGFLRYRVPVHGEKAALDFQVVIDGAMKVAGLGLLPHAAEAAAGDPVREIDLGVGAGDDALPGTLSLPEGEGPFPAVVLVHGSGPNDRDESILGNRPFRDIAHGLAARGVAALRYDKRSFARPQSLMGHGASLTVRHEVVDDAVAAVAALRARAEIDPARVFVLGHSLGGTLAPRIARQAKADGMIIMAGATRRLSEVMIEQSEYLAALDDTVTADEAAEIAQLKTTVAALRQAQQSSPPSTEWFLGAPAGYYADLDGYDGPTDAATLDIPISILQGARDYQVTLEDLAGWRRALGARPHVCMKVYGDLDHLMRAGEGRSGPADYATPRPVAAAVIDDIARFVLGGCPGPVR